MYRRVQASVACDQGFRNALSLVRSAVKHRGEPGQITVKKKMGKIYPKKSIRFNFNNLHVYYLYYVIPHALCNKNE